MRARGGNLSGGRTIRIILCIEKGGVPVAGSEGSRPPIKKIGEKVINITKLEGERF